MHYVVMGTQRRKDNGNGKKNAKSWKSAEVQFFWQFKLSLGAISSTVHEFCSTVMNFYLVASYGIRTVFFVLSSST